MKIIIKMLMMVISMTYPMELNSSSNICCINCAMKKEDEIEVVVDEVEDTEA